MPSSCASLDGYSGRPWDCPLWVGWRDLGRRCSCGRTQNWRFTAVTASLAVYGKKDSISCSLTWPLRCTTYIVRKLLPESQMARVVIETRIAAPIELCFDLARDVGTHVRTSVRTRERVVAGKTSGLLDIDDVVTFEAVHFGVTQQLTSKIVEFDRPRRFVD